MVRMHTQGRGESGSTKPVVDSPPEWSCQDEEAIEEKIIELSKKGLSSSEIGIKLRDQGVKGKPVPDVKLVTGKKISEILKENDLSPEYPEDLVNLMKKAIKIRDHLENQPNDKSNKRALQNTENKIRRLINYYKSENKLPENFRYNEKLARDILE